MVAEGDASVAASVTIKSVDGPEDVVLQAVPSATLAELKVLLSTTLRRPEIVDQGDFVSTMPNGDVMPINDKQKLGVRVTLDFAGAPLCPPPEDLPPCSLSNFEDDGADRNIGTPRSLLACQMAGISVEDLYYVPLDDYTLPGMSFRLARLRHDFFEVFRRDSIAICLEMRQAVVAGQSRTCEPSEKYPETYSFLQKMHSKFVDLEKVPQRALATTALKRRHASQPACKSSQTAERWCCGNKQLHIRAEPRLRGAKTGELILPGDDFLVSHETLDGDGLLWLELADGTGWVTEGKPGGSSGSTCQKSSTRVRLQEEQERLFRSTQDLHGLPGSCEESTLSLAHHTQTLAVGQPRGERRVLKDMHAKRQFLTERQVEAADEQMVTADEDHEDVQGWWDYRRDAFWSSRGPWKTPLQGTRSDAAAKRDEYWVGRREVIHQQEIDAEERRNEVLEKRVRREMSRENLLQQQRNLHKVRMASTWIDRRVRWARNDTENSRAADRAKAAALKRQADANARENEQREHLRDSIAFRHELKELRLLMKAEIAARKAQREGYYRRADAEHTRRIDMQMAAAKADEVRDEATLRSLADWNRSTLRRLRREASEKESCVEAAVREGLLLNSNDALASSAPNGGATSTLGVPSQKQSKWAKARSAGLLISAATSLQPHLNKSMSAGSISHTGTGVPTQRIPRFDWSRFSAETAVASAAASGGALPLSTSLKSQKIGSSSGFQLESSSRRSMTTPPLTAGTEESAQLTLAA